MSRTFSKVLVICAMVVVLPLMIVGTAFAAFYSIDDVVNVATVFVDGLKSPSEDVYARVLYEDTRSETLEIKEGHTKVVEITADFSPVAYKFEGWYQGTAEDYANGKGVLATEDKNLSVKMVGTANYVAVYSALKYSVSFEYLENPEDTSTFKEVAAKEYIYGEALPNFSGEYKGNVYDWAGWMINKEGADDTRYNAVTFEDKTVNLYAPWKEKSAVTISFKYGDKTVTKEIHANVQWEIPAITDEFFNGLGIEQAFGYNYEWKTSDGIVHTSISTDVDMELTLVKTLKSYTVGLTLSDETKADLKEDLTTEEITFTVENFSVFEKWLAYEAKYSFWKVDGIKYGETTYTAENLQDLAVAYATDETKTFDLVIEKVFTTVTADGIKYFSSSSDENKVYNLPVYWDDTSVNGNRLEWVGEASGNSTITLEEFLDINYTDATIVVYVNGGDTKAELREIVFTLNGTRLTINASQFTFAEGASFRTLTLNDVIEKAIALYKNVEGTDVTLENAFTITNLQANFYPVGEFDGNGGTTEGV